MKLPDFLIIGASKSGTTSLYAWLDGHPGVFMSPIKETNFFAYAPDNDSIAAWGSPVTVEFPVRTLEDYAALFEPASDGARLGEASPVYLESAGAPDRIHETLGRPRLVVTLRNPVDRAYSGYWMAVRHGHESRPPEEAFGPDEQRVQVGFYHALLSRYVERFGAEQLHVMLFDDLTAHPLDVFAELCRFLQIDDGHAPDVGTQHNVGGVPRSRLLYSLGTSGPVMRAVMRVMPPGLKARLRKRMMRGTPELSGELRRRLIGIYEDDIRALQELIGRDLSAWLEAG